MIGKDEVPGSNPGISSKEPVRNDWFFCLYTFFCAKVKKHSCTLAEVFCGESVVLRPVCLRQIQYLETTGALNALRIVKFGILYMEKVVNRRCYEAAAMGTGKSGPYFLVFAAGGFLRSCAGYIFQAFVA